MQQKQPKYHTDNKAKVRLKQQNYDTSQKEDIDELARLKKIKMKFVMDQFFHAYHVTDYFFQMEYELLATNLGKGWIAYMQSSVGVYREVLIYVN